MESTWLDVLSAAASVATAAGVFVAVLQIRAEIRISTVEFEDELDREAREIALALPMEALFGEPLPPELAAKSLEQFHRYVDLCNQQVFLRNNGRISNARWETWCDEIKINLAKPAFAAAWDEIKRRAPAEFILLRRLESTNFDTDPKEW
jgi:hypothetical protein